MVAPCRVVEEGEGPATRHVVGIESSYAGGASLVADGAPGGGKPMPAGPQDLPDMKQESADGLQGLLFGT